MPFLSPQGVKTGIYSVDKQGQEIGKNENVGSLLMLSEQFNLVNN